MLMFSNACFSCVKEMQEDVKHKERRGSIEKGNTYRVRQRHRRRQGEHLVRGNGREHRSDPNSSNSRAGA